VEKDVDGIKIMLAHGSPKSFFDYIYPDTPAGRLEELTEGVSCDYLAVGHTHKPAILKTRRMAILNPGSVGQPRDGDTRASCMVFDTATRDARIIKVKYDLEAVCRKIRIKMPHAAELEAILRRGY
jgi:putative phosphoesterase